MARIIVTIGEDGLVETTGLGPGDILEIRDYSENIVGVDTPYKDEDGDDREYVLHLDQPKVQHKSASKFDDDKGCIGGFHDNAYHDDEGCIGGFHDN